MYPRWLFVLFLNVYNKKRKLKNGSTEQKWLSTTYYYRKLSRQNVDPSLKSEIENARNVIADKTEQGLKSVNYTSNKLRSSEL